MASGKPRGEVASGKFDPRVAGAAKWQAAKWFALAATATQVIYFTKNTTGKSIFNEVSGASKQPSASGVYSSFITIGNIYTEFMF